MLQIRISWPGWSSYSVTFVSFQSVFNVWSLRSMRTQTNKKKSSSLEMVILKQYNDTLVLSVLHKPWLTCECSEFVYPSWHSCTDVSTCVFPNVCGNLQASSLSRLNSSLHLWECVGSRQTWMMNMMISDMCEYVSLTFQSPSFTRISWLIVRKYSLFTVTKNNVRPPEN